MDKESEASDDRSQAPLEKVPEDEKVVYTMFFRHWKTGKVVRRSDGKPFRFTI